MNKKFDLLGQKFGRLLVVSPAPNDKNRNRCWVCLCECGKTCTVQGYSLKSGHTRSCGCLVKETAANLGKSNTTHGDFGTRLYKIWTEMKSRCYNHNRSDFPRYGGRGITVCSQWHQYPLFRDWAIANGYADGLTIERVNNSGPYSPENCRWATYREQNRNKRNNIIIAGKCLADWAEKYGLKYSTLYMRIRTGWPLEKALTEPIHKI